MNSSNGSGFPSFPRSISDLFRFYAIWLTVADVDVTRGPTNLIINIINKHIVDGHDYLDCGMCLLTNCLPRVDVQMFVQASKSVPNQLTKTPFLVCH